MRLWGGSRGATQVREPRALQCMAVAGSVLRAQPQVRARCARRARRWAEGSRRDIGGQPGHHRVLAMAEIVLRVGLTGGDHMDVTYEESDTVNADEVVEHVVSTLAQDSGVLRTRHGDRFILLYGRGVAAVEVAPRGAVV